MAELQTELSDFFDITYFLLDKNMTLLLKTFTMQAA